jgi:alanine dehydrogenase
MLSIMKPASVLVDVAIDQGGCFETSSPTTHDNPTYIKEGIIHYCVTNMPGTVGQTATYALTNATHPFILILANTGITESLRSDEYIREGAVIYRGKLVHESVAKAHGYGHSKLEQLINQR